VRSPFSIVFSSARRRLVRTQPSGFGCCRKCKFLTRRRTSPPNRTNERPHKTPGFRHGSQHSRTGLWRTKSLFPGNGILQGRDKGPKTTPEIQSTACRDKMRARIPANSGLFATSRELELPTKRLSAASPEPEQRAGLWVFARTAAKSGAVSQGGLVTIMECYRR
jgi:hypothetical protein